MKLPSILKQPHFKAALSLYDGPTHCGVCSSLNLNKSTSYLSLCLSLNSFCNGTSRTWASLGPEARYCGFWLGWVPGQWVQVPNRVLAGFESHLWGFKSQAGFWLGSSPDHVVSSPKLGFGWAWVPAHGFKSQSEVNSFKGSYGWSHLYYTRLKTLFCLFSFVSVCNFYPFLASQCCV